MLSEKENKKLVEKIIELSNKIESMRGNDKYRYVEIKNPYMIELLKDKKYTYLKNKKCKIYDADSIFALLVKNKP